MNTDDLVSTLKHGYAQAAQGAGTVLSRVGLLGDTAPSRDDRLRHWAFSLTRVHDSLAMNEMDVPWWTYRAIDVVDAWLQARTTPVRVMEFGCGASTLWLSRRATEVHTVEHHTEFAEHIRSAFDEHPNIDFHVVPSTRPAVPVVPSAKEGYAGQDFSAYVSTIEEVGGEFDLVVVDGRAREACLHAAVPHLAPGGIIVFDNSFRTRYRTAIDACGLAERRLRGLAPTLPYPDQTSLLSAP